MEKQKWINEGGVYFPIPGYATIYTSPGNGVFQIMVDNFQHRLGLERVADSFEFDFKLYDLGCEDIFERVTKTWLSDTFSTGNKNLIKANKLNAVIFVQITLVDKLLAKTILHPNC